MPTMGSPPLRRPFATRKPFSPFQNPMFRSPYEPSIPSTEEDPSMEPTLPPMPTMGSPPLRRPFATRKPFSPFQNPMFRFPYEPSIPSTEEDPSMEPTLP